MKLESESDDKGMSRREFILKAGATAVGVVAGSMMGGKLFAQSGPAPGSVIGANDRSNIAVIGVGGMGSGHVNTVKKLSAEQNVQIVAICDVWEKRRRQNQKRAELADNQIYSDYRKLLENKDIDLVVIATPDHWHATIAIAAMEAGKHVYVEKPMARYQDEALKMHATAKRTKRLVQVGSQACTDAKWHKAGELVREGKIGTVLSAQGSYRRNNPKGEWNYPIDPELTPETCDWNAWLGKAPKRPFSPERFFRWRKYWDYGTGIIGDLWPHRLHPLMIAMNCTDFPYRVACVGKNICNTDNGYGEPRDVADETMMLAEMPSGTIIYVAGSTVNERGLEDMIRGNKANMYFGGGKIQIRPERPYADEIEEQDISYEGPSEDVAEHHKNFWYCIRSNKEPNCGIDLGLRVQTIVCMAEESYRKNKMAVWDPVKQRII
ncbi:MAG: Gfo/Idh/MocA family oxidoreductase [Armatimonadetes bacterium]|nr:Gfo/Idh/MocA family oxidoreductase [Armatimonadota bacterium]